MTSNGGLAVSERSDSRDVVFAVVLCAAAFVLLVGSMTGWIKADALGAVGVQLSHNSEAYLVILLLVPWIQFVRPRIAGTSAEWPVTILAAAVCFGVGYWFWDIVTIGGPGKTSVTTLNEGLFGLAFLLPYVMFRRPLPRLVPWTISLGVLVLTAVFNQNTTVVDMAEVLGYLVLFPISLDLVDRRVLEPDARTEPAVRYGWYVFLVAVPVLFAVLQRKVLDGPPKGAFQEAVRYLVRPTECFLAALVICVYFAVLLGRTGVSSRRRSVARAGASTEATASGSVA